VSCVIAETFARIFYRNAINIGLPILECPEAVTGTIRNLDTGQVFQAAPYPPFVMDIISAGGLIEFTRKELTK
jgi:3-isopropylmalate/(R)-2-methylmalate dehydratase small subunit